MWCRGNMTDVVWRKLDWPCESILQSIMVMYIVVGTISWLRLRDAWQGEIFINPVIVIIVRCTKLNQTRPKITQSSRLDVVKLIILEISLNLGYHGRICYTRGKTYKRGIVATIHYTNPISPWLNILEFIIAKYTYVHWQDVLGLDHVSLWTLILSQYHAIQSSITPTYAHWSPSSRSI